jgi:hypothetical protein
MTIPEVFIAGMITSGYLVISLFFLKFWNRSGDLLFIAFSAAFFLLAANQFLLAVGGVPAEEQSWVFLLRIAAFLLIALAIVHKNTGPRSR